MNSSSYNDETSPKSPVLTSFEQFTHTKYRFENGGLLIYDSKASSTFLPSLPDHGPHNLKSLIPKPPHTDLSRPEEPTNLTFNSNFECGNLQKAVKLSDYEYNLYLKSDSGNQNHNHWYYFSVHNPRKSSVTFRICNLKKYDPLYDLGMKPSLWSCRSKEFDNHEWHRGGTCISYLRNSKEGFTLTFTYSFKYPDDTVYFAYATPYSYTDLSLYLQMVKQSHSDIVRLSQLCETNEKRECQFLTITESVRDYLEGGAEAKDMEDVARSVGRFRGQRKTSFSNSRNKLGEKHVEKKGIVLMARVHSGETVSSFMLQGAVDYLVSPCRNAVALRRNFVFKIVPMLNPDGVCAGNYRCCLNGVDLNRKWLRPNKKLFPTIFYAKVMVLALAARHSVMMVCDFHGHTKKRNVFIYGCSVKPESYFDIRNNLLARIAPYYLHTQNKFFSFKLSHYRLEKYKESTSRIVFFNELKIPHSYTMEASFFGGQCNNSHFSAQDLASLGKDLCRFCMVFCNKSMYLRTIDATNTFLREINARVHSKKFTKIIKASATFECMPDEDASGEACKEEILNLGGESKVEERCASQIFKETGGNEKEEFENEKEISDTDKEQEGNNNKVLQERSSSSEVLKDGDIKKCTAAEAENVCEIFKDEERIENNSNSQGKLKIIRKLTIQGLEKIVSDNEEFEGSENLSSSEEELLETIDEAKFWSEVKLVTCSPDVDSSGSDSEITDKEEVEAEAEAEKVDAPSHRRYPNPEILVQETVNVSLKKKVKSIDRENFVVTRKRSNPRVIKNSSLSNNKRTSESLNLQTFRFPDTENETKARKMFEPLRASVNLQCFKQFPKSPVINKRTSLNFLPALVVVNKSYLKPNKPNTFESFSEQLSKFISQTSYTKVKK